MMNRYDCVSPSFGPLAVCRARLKRRNGLLRQLPHLLLLTLLCAVARAETIDQFTYTSLELPGTGLTTVTFSLVDGQAADSENVFTGIRGHLASTITYKNVPLQASTAVGVVTNDVISFSHVTDGTADFSFTIPGIFGPTTYSGTCASHLFDFPSPDPTNPHILPSFAAGTCQFDNNKLNDSEGTSPLYSSSLEITQTSDMPVTAAPEPSTLALLGTGIFGVAGALKRRRA